MSEGINQHGVAAIITKAATLAKLGNDPLQLANAVAAVIDESELSGEEKAEAVRELKEALNV